MEESFVPNNFLPREQSCKVLSTASWAKFRKLLSYCLFPETLLSCLLGFQLPACLLCCLAGAAGGLARAWEFREVSVSPLLWYMVLVYLVC